jgi:hypothetical protein
MTIPSIPAGMVLADKDVIDEMRDVLEELKKEKERMGAEFESDPQLNANIKEVCRLNAFSTVLVKRRDELMNEKNEAIREVKHWKNKFERLLKAKERANGK